MDSDRNLTMMAIDAHRSLEIIVDGEVVGVDDETATLLDVLRAVGKTSVKDGCSPQGQCGCCTVLVDGQPRVSCVTPVRRVRGREITTVDGIDAADADRWSPFHFYLERQIEIEIDEQEHGPIVRRILSRLLQAGHLSRRPMRAGFMSARATGTAFFRSCCVGSVGPLAASTEWSAGKEASNAPGTTS